MNKAPSPEVEKGGLQWSIVDGSYNRERFKMDSSRLDRVEIVARDLPQVAATRLLATETVTYAYELCNPELIENDQTLASEVHFAVAEVSFENSQEAPSSVALTARKAETGPLVGAPIIQALNHIFSERRTDDEDLQAHCKATVVKLARREPALRLSDTVQ